MTAVRTPLGVFRRESGVWIGPGGRLVQTPVEEMLLEELAARDVDAIYADVRARWHDVTVRQQWDHTGWVVEFGDEHASHFAEGPSLAEALREGLR